MNQTTNSYLMGERPLTDFHTYYRKKIRPYLLDLERKREQFLSASKVNQQKYLFLASLVGLLLSGITYKFDLLGEFSWAYAIFLFITPLLVMKYWLAPVIQEQESHDDQHEAFYNRYKSKVVEAIVRFFDPSLRLKYEEQISKATVRKSLLVQDLSQIELEGDDFVSGSVNKIPVSFSELQLTDVSQRTNQDIFHGIFFSAVLSHSYEGSLFILPKTVLHATQVLPATEPLHKQKPLRPQHRAHNIRITEQTRHSLNPWSPANSDLPLQEIPILHPEASQYYVAFSSQPQQAQQILSSSFWNILFPCEDNAEVKSEGEQFRDWASQDEFMQAVSQGYYISLDNDSLYIMQPQGGELFEPDMEQTFLDEKGFATYHDHLQQAFSLMENINHEVSILSDRI